ncbi:MAG TPA: Hsp33 family molecular chaperone HslO [Caldimonas sp.]|nr:Hsp33 family molecular chaperone HslO [Caldimonas sp.]HEX2540507.1 Hsp33 family molecular chaperone HslO [Caldimonas sp.]
MSELHRFLFDGLPVRGILVRLTDSWQEVLARRADAALPQPVQRVLGEMAAAGVLMHANIKFNGALVLQVFGDGPVQLAVAKIASNLAFRVTAKVAGQVPADAGLQAMLNVHGRGRCAITLDRADKLPGQQAYQGVVPLHDDAGAPLQAIAPVLEHYMLQSEQLDTRLVLAADEHVAAGLLLQRLPGRGRAGDESVIGRDEDFNRVAHLAATLRREELLGLDTDTVLRRLFHEEKVLRFPALVGEHAPRFACSCSRGKVGNMLQSLGRAEVDDILREQGGVEVGCDFCGAKYRFDPVDVGELFTPPAQQAPGSAALN